MLFGKCADERGREKLACTVNTPLLLYFREDHIEFWMENGNGQTVPFLYRGSNVLPLYFSLEGDAIVAGSFAQKQLQKTEEVSAGSFWSVLEKEHQTVTRFNKEMPAGNLLFLFLKEELLPLFAKQTSGEKTFEQFLQSARVRLVFDPCISEKQTALVLRGLREETRFPPAALLETPYWAVFRRLIARKFEGLNMKTVWTMFAAFGDLYLCAIAPEAPYEKQQKVIAGRGLDAQKDLLAEILAERAIEKGGSLLSPEEARKQIFPQVAPFVEQIQTGLIEGTVQLSDIGKVSVQFLSSILTTRLDNRASLNLIKTETDAFRQENGLEESALFLLGEMANAESFTSFFSLLYNPVHPQWTGYEKHFLQECFQVAFDSGLPTVGIDLGTTYSCISYVDKEGLAQVIKNSEGQTSTPSIIWFDGQAAYVGKKANDRKIQANAPIFEFVKRDMGEEGRKRYRINGFDYKAQGLAAILLRKLKGEAFLFLKKQGLLPADSSLKTTVIPAVITVPAYFGDKQRQETRCSGYAAGFEVVAIINEPTAAALTYGISLYQPQRILVFDLGGGTFDVTILDISNGGARVIATDGLDQLGGKDWDTLIQSYIFEAFEQQTGEELPDDRSWEVQQLALDVKFALTERTETSITISAAGETAELTFFRELTNGNSSPQTAFYFEERAAKLLAQCRKKLISTLEKAGLQWSNIDEILLAGGASRMPMIPKMIEALAGKTIKRNIPGFSYDTAISQGAALFGQHRERVTDVCAKSIGVEVIQNGERAIARLISKNSPLPVSASRTFGAEPQAELVVYEGEGSTPDTCRRRGRLALENGPGKVTVTVSVDVNGVIQAAVSSQDVNATLRIAEDAGADTTCEELKQKIESIDLR